MFERQGGRVAYARAVASNVLLRREGTFLCVPINPASNPGGRIVACAVAEGQRLAGAMEQAADVLRPQPVAQGSTVS